METIINLSTELSNLIEEYNRIEHKTITLEKLILIGICLLTQSVCRAMALKLLKQVS